MAEHIYATTSCGLIALMLGAVKIEIAPAFRPASAQKILEYHIFQGIEGFTAGDGKKSMVVGSRFLGRSSARLSDVPAQAGSIRFGYSWRWHHFTFSHQNTPCSMHHTGQLFVQAFGYMDNERHAGFLVLCSDSFQRVQNIRPGKPVSAICVQGFLNAFIEVVRPGQNCSIKLAFLIFVVTLKNTGNGSFRLESNLSGIIRA
jgi:hypothetical protein